MRTILFLLLALPIFTAPGCTPQTPLKKYKIGFSQCCDDPWRDVMEREMLRELAFHPELDIDIKVAFNDSEQQIDQIKAMMLQHIDLLIVSPNESQPLTPIIEEVFNSGIPVILIDRKTTSEKYTAYIGADNYEIGSTAADYIAGQLEGEGHILELQLGMTMTPAQDRSRGFKNALSKYPKLHMVSQLEMAKGMDELKVDFEQTLKQHPELNVVFGHNDFLAESAYKWSQESGRASQIFFVGIDGIPGMGKGIQAVEDGILNASLLYPTGGSDAIRLALAILNNLPYEKENVMQTIVINSTNARMLHLQMKKEESLQKSIDGQIKQLDDLNSIYRDQRLYIWILVFSLLLAIVLGGVLFKSLKTKNTMNKVLEVKNREVLEREQQIVTMSDELRVATNAKVAFFTNISHEFRTPLTLILGHIESLLTAGNIGGKDARQDLSLVRKNALRLLRLVNQIMDFRKIENNKLAVRASENDLIQFTTDIVNAYQKMAGKRNIDLILLAHEKTLPVWFDVTMLDKVLFNLLSNAFKFTADNGKIKVTIVKDAIINKAIIKVEDTGAGMTREQLERAFEPFYQGGGGRTKGTGLGLSLSKELVLLHSGHIEAWSEKNRGTRFEVALPLGTAHFREDQLLREKPDNISYDDELIYFEVEKNTGNIASPSDKTHEYTLLLIEDNEDMRQFLKKQFSKTYHVIEASDGIEGQEKAMEEMPDLIVADIMMPGKDGLALTKILKTDLRTSHIPIVLLTAQNTMEQKIEGIQTGADAYVTKPFNLVFLSEIIKNLLSGRATLREVFSAVIQPGRLPASMGDLDQQFLRKFTGLVEEQFGDQTLSVERLSEHFGLSRVQLYRKVKALTGESANDYIQNVRLRKASQMLLEGELNVAEIAYKTGYSSPAYFSTAFKAKYACSPTEYKERHTPK